MQDDTIQWEDRPAGTIQPGDRTKWGYGDVMQHAYRTVSQVEKIGRGIVRIRHKETDSRFYDEYAEGYVIKVARRDATRRT